MATPDSDMEKIRLKRLAKLQSSSKGPSPTPEQKGEATGSGNGRRGREEIVSSLTPQPDTAGSSLLSIGVPSPQRDDESSREASPSKRPKPTPIETPQQPSSAGKPGRTLEDWEDRTLGSIFKFTLQPGASRGDQYHLQKLQAELEADGEAVKLSTAILDQAILSICSSSHLKTSPFDYLLSCWKRAVHYQRLMRPTGNGDEFKLNVVAEAKRIAMCYAEYCITMPDMFEDVDAAVRLEDKLVMDPDEEGGLPLEFLQALVARFEEEPALEEAFGTAIENLSIKLNLLDLSSNYKPYLIALMKIVSNKLLAKLFIESPTFLPTNIAAHDIETSTLLGPYFKLSPLQQKTVELYFSALKTRTPTALSDATRALRLTVQTTQDQLFQIINTLIRTSPEARNKMLDWFAKVLNLNVKRAAIQVEPTTVASDGFMLNVTAVLTRLCEPFMDVNYSKIAKVEIEYLRRNSRLDISLETKLNADDQASGRYYSQKSEGENNFISEIFFLTVAAHHYGLGATETTHDQLGKDLYEMEKHLESMQQERDKWLNSPQLPVFDRQLERLRDRIEKGHSYRYALDVILYDSVAQARTLQFMRYLTTWLLRIVSPNRSYPHTPISLPLPGTPPDEFSYLPEYFVENIGLCFGFVGRWIPQIVIGTQVEELVTFCITFLRNSTYIRNPHLKSRLVEILYYGIQPNRMKPNGMLGDAIMGHKFALQYLMHSLMNFYIEIESQYYQKFTVRYHISEIIKRMWDNHSYREKLELESRLNPDFFIRFVALLLNDVTYVMDHSLTALGDIHRLQRELESTTLTTQERTEKEKALQKSERDASSYMALGNETVVMLKLFTAALADAFVQPEIVHRLAGMLDYNLDALVGPRCSDLKVKNPEKYGFHPKVLLVNFSEVYLNLRNKPAFIEAVAKDGRSYRPEIFTRLQGLLARFELRSREERAELAKLAEEVEEVKKREEEGEEELGDIPDEFLDPLMATLMEDPVILPSSRVTVDRGTIKAHLLSDAKDPFNRSPLKIEDVISNTELKAQIEAFKQERRKLRTADKMEVDT
ncbi:ubiquitin elongating factor core-domain-containing protein [Kalaharituber pfeilii]|nr:ubiquitin elongating factor core-domain-containing protein [Kalaharituber pfeilii]